MAARLAELLAELTGLREYGVRNSESKEIRRSDDLLSPEEIRFYDTSSLCFPVP